MRVKVTSFEGQSGLKKLAPAWRKLSERLETRRHFHCVEWYLALADTLERKAGITVTCLAISSSDELLGVFPFRAARVELAGVPLHALQLLSDAWEAETARDLVLAPAQAQDEFFQAFVHLLDQNDASWDVISLRGILDDSVAAAALHASPDLPCVRTPGGAWGRVEFVSCGATDRPFDRLSKGFRQNLRTAHNHLKSSAVSFSSTRSPHGLAAAYPKFLAVESSGWKGVEGTSVMKSPTADSFLRNLISQFGSSGGCEIHLMHIEERTVAALFCVVTDDICYILKTAYDEAFARMSPGHLTLERLLQQRGATGRLQVVTPYNAPPWFRAWRPDEALGIHNAYVFRPSQQGHELAVRVHSTLSRANASALQERR